MLSLKAQGTITYLCFAFLTAVGFQNCAKIGVTDAAIPMSKLDGTMGNETLPDLVIVTPETQMPDAQIDDQIDQVDHTDTQAGTDAQAGNDSSATDDHQAEQAENPIDQQQQVDQPQQQEEQHNDQVADNSSQDDQVIDDDSSQQEVADDDAASAGSCGGHSITDVLLNVDSVSANSCGQGSDSVMLVGSNNVMSLNNMSLQIKALKSTTINSLKLVLKDGNKVLSSESEMFDLKTPSAQQSGLKIHLGQKMQLIEGEIYTLTLNISLEKQIVHNKKKCIFKPVVKSAVLEGASIALASNDRKGHK